MKSVSKEIAESRKNRILIVGNGFDLDLGFNTSYKMFCEAHFKDNVIIDQYCKSSLFRFLKERYDKYDNWFNLEDEIRNYVLKSHFTCSSTKKKDILYFKYLNYYIHFWMTTFGYTTEYNEREEYHQDNSNNFDSTVNPCQVRIPNSDSIAYDIIKHIVINESYFNQIISFNYTKFNNILHCVLGETSCFNQSQLNIKINQLPPVQYLHCNFNDDTVILGIEQDVLNKNHHKVKIPKAFSFIQKCNQFSTLSERQRVIENIATADELVIFGHSLGTSDSDYFRPLFKDMFAEKPLMERKITIITCDNNRDILKQIEMYAEKDIFLHNNYKNIHFLYTDKKEESRIALSALFNGVLNYGLLENSKKL